MTIRERYDKVIDWFEKTMPEVKTELHYKSPFHLLISVILSAQCTDKRVNLVTPALFEAFPSPNSLALSDADVVYEYIKSVSYPKNKAKNLIAMAKMVVKEFGGEIPSDRRELIKLPGVGRKTANLIVSIAFHIPAMAVDTHVFRVSNRIGLTHNATTPLQTEKILTKYIQKRLWERAHHWLILHGRYVCMARKPHCEKCGLHEYCKYCKSVNENNRSNPIS